MRVWPSLSGLIVALVCSASATAGPDFKRIATFGDSLSDPRNFYVETGEFVVRPFEPIAGAPYAIGGLHFGNGPTWVEQLARRLRMNRSARPALKRPGVYTNYAYGRARARPSGPFSLETQVGLFLEDFDQVAADDTLYALFIGANDVRDALTNPTMAAGILTAAITSTAAAINDLWSAGGRMFLVLNVPNLANVPAILVLNDPVAEAAAEALTVQYNDALANALAGLAALPGIEIITVDVFARLNDVVEYPEHYGLTNVTDSCITPGVIAHAICKHPGGYLFWDFIHPTLAGQRLLREEAEAVLDAAFAP